MELMTIADICLALNVGRSTVYRMVRDGVLPQPRRMGNFRQGYWVRSELEKAFRRQMR